jgi:hypothetical protein
LNVTMKMIWFWSEASRAASRTRAVRAIGPGSGSIRSWSESILGGEPTDVDEMTVAPTWTAARFGTDCGGLMSAIAKA